MSASFRSDPSTPREGVVAVNNGELFYRDIGQGRPIIVLHGGPDFDHTYLLPDLDRLSDSYRLIYYDQRGRGKSAGEVHAISLESEVEDLDRLRESLQLDSVAILGHSWGGVLALAYALRHPERVSHLILLNTAPASREDILVTRREIATRTAAHAETLNELKSSAAYEAGDPETVDAYYRLRFSTTIKRPEHLKRLNFGFTHFTKEDVQRARAIEEQLYQETYQAESFSLLPQLKQLSTPTLVVHGDYDFIPVPCAAHIAETIPGARLVVLKDCGHFAYIEAPEAVRQVIADFFADA